MNDDLQTRAIEWHIRLRDGDDATWEAFSDWLGQDARHRAAYEAIEQADLAIGPLLPHVAFPETTSLTDLPQSQTPPYGSRRWWLAGGALAASVAVAAVLLPHFASSRYDVVTGPGQHQTVALDSTTQVILNGSTRMTFDRHDARFARLISGEALFRVQHDNTRPFTLELGNDRIRDVGTIFNVVRDPDEVRVAVAEGKVIYNTPTQAVPLDAGQALLARSDSGALRTTTTPITSIGSWQQGHLFYSGEPLSQVAADLGRSLGISITVAPSIANRPFSGAITLDGAGAEQLQRLKLALNVDLEAGPAGWTLKPVADGGN